jgi:hypothetical protein
MNDSINLGGWDKEEIVKVTSTLLKKLESPEGKWKWHLRDSSWEGENAFHAQDDLIGELEASDLRIETNVGGSLIVGFSSLYLSIAGKKYVVPDKLFLGEMKCIVAILQAKCDVLKAEREAEYSAQRQVDEKRREKAHRCEVEGLLSSLS